MNSLCCIDADCVHARKKGLVLGAGQSMRACKLCAIAASPSCLEFDAFLATAKHARNVLMNVHVKHLRHKILRRRILTFAASVS